MSYFLRQIFAWTEEEGANFLSIIYHAIIDLKFFRQPYCANTTNVNLCSHIWSICYLAQSVFDKNEIIAEPCLRKCPSGVNLQPASTRPDRTPKSRYGFALNYGIPMGQSTPKTWFEWISNDEWFLMSLFLVCFISLSASGSFCVKSMDPPFCPRRDSEIGDKRCCLEAPEWNELI